MIRPLYVSDVAELELLIAGPARTIGDLVDGRPPSGSIWIGGFKTGEVGLEISSAPPPDLDDPRLRAR